MNLGPKWLLKPNNSVEGVKVSDDLMKILFPVDDKQPSGYIVFLSNIVIKPNSGIFSLKLKIDNPKCGEIFFYSDFELFSTLRTLTFPGC